MFLDETPGDRSRSLINGKIAQLDSNEVKCEFYNGSLKQGLPDYRKYEKYLGIESDPLKKTNENYHVRYY